MLISRRMAIGLPFLIASCASSGPPLRQSFPPLTYSYLTPLRLNVGEIVLGEPPPPGPLDAQDPVPPAQALLQMARDRLSAGGSLGRAVFVIDQASIQQIPGGLVGNLAVHLDVLTSDGSRAGFAEARVSRQALGGLYDLRGALYDITKQMMDDMNVEFEFQLRHSLHDWLQDTSTAPPPAPVQEQNLPAPGSPGAPPVNSSQPSGQIMP